MDRPGREISVAVREGLEQLGREAVRQIVEHVLARRDVDLYVAPLLGWNFGKPTLQKRFASGDDLNDGGMSVLEVALDPSDQGRRLHRGDQV